MGLADTVATGSEAVVVLAAAAVVVAPHRQWRVGRLRGSAAFGVGAVAVLALTAASVTIGRPGHDHGEEAAAADEADHPHASHAGHDAGDEPSTAASGSGHQDHAASHDTDAAEPA